jgi:aminoglycoside phosphotransferase
MEQLALPEAVRSLVGNAEIVPVTVGRSAAATWRISRPGSDWFVKAQPLDPLGTSLVGEGERMRWFAPFVPVPEVVEAGTEERTEWLVTAALPGSDATNPEHHVDVERLVRTLGMALRRFHDEVPVDGCPFDATTPTDVERARLRTEAGRVDASDFAAIYQGLSARALFDLMVDSGVPDGDDLVVLHGDFCVPNVVIHQGSITGYLDVGRAGVGDRHRDVAIACGSIARNFGGHAVGLFVDAYGTDRPDLARLDFFAMLDEFF